MLTHFDDCAGIGGFSLAAEWAGGITTIAARELDPYARRVYALRFPHVRLYGDVRGPVPDESPDLYTCGFPCQPVSVAGKRLGEKDPRWLWPDIARTIRLLRPRWVLLENTAGLRFRGMGQVLWELCSLGFDAEWGVVSACSMGAPHTRDRLFIVAHADGFNGQAGLGFWPEAQRTLPGVNDLACARADWLESISRMCGRANGVPRRIREIAGYANAIVPQVAYRILQRIVEADASLGALR